VWRPEFRDLGAAFDEFGLREIFNDIAAIPGVTIGPDFQYIDGWDMGCFCSALWMCRHSSGLASLTLMIPTGWTTTVSSGLPSISWISDWP
jgi:hypothetical protein